MAYLKERSNKQTRWIIASVASLILVCVIGLVLCFTLQKVTQPGRGLPAMPSCWLSPVAHSLSQPRLCPHVGQLFYSVSPLRLNPIHPSICLSLTNHTKTSPQQRVPLAFFPYTRLQLP